MTPQHTARMVSGAILIFVLVILGSSATYVVEPGYRGVAVTLGHVSPHFRPEGFGLKLPFLTTIIPRSIRQHTTKMQTDCYSADLQQVKIDVRLLYRVPQVAVVRLYRDYAGDPFEMLIRPRTAEAIKEITALRRAEVIVQNREELKNLALEASRAKVGDLLVIEDLVVEDISLTDVLESAIEAKMVQEQEAARARFAQQQAQIEASTIVIKAKGEAESINLRGKALRENPHVLQLETVERWDGVTPLVIGPDASGAGMLLPLGPSVLESSKSQQP